MKVQVIYTSLTGCTRKVAEAIYEGVTADCKSIHDLKDGVPVLDGDVILVGYWGVEGGPCEQMQAFLKTIRNKAVGIFCTLGYYADSAHAFDTVQTGIKLVSEHNQVIGSYVCNGAVAGYLKKGQGFDENSVLTEQKQLRWEMIRSHPTQAECALAAERFRERVELYRRSRELNIPLIQIV